MSATHILVVDDDAGDRRLIRRLTQKIVTDAKLREVDSFEDARTISGEAFSFIFLDHRLPGGSGLDLISSFRSRWPRAAIFMMTGQGDEQLAKSAILLGATDYITKDTLDEPNVARMMKAGAEVVQMRSQIEDQHEELSVFSETLIHDLKAPLRAIRFLSEQIAEDMTDGAVGAASEGLEMMHEQVGRMADLIDSLSGHIGLGTDGRPESVSLAELVERATRSVSREIADAGARIKVEGGDLAIQCLPTDVAQLLQNLVANAIKYASDAPPEIVVTGAPHGAGVQVSVADNGIGVPAAYREKIFEPFKRIQNGGNVPGSGLGLSTCRKIVRRHNGQIWCAADRTEGTTIVFTLNGCTVYETPKSEFFAA